MTKDTSRDRVWSQALYYVTAEENFNLDQIIAVISDAPSRRTVRDTLNTMIDYGWLAKPSPRAHEWTPGPRAKGEPYDESASSSSGNQYTPTEEVGATTPSDLETGTKYTAEVGRFSGDNGLVELERGHINLGPIDKAVMGERVPFELKRGSGGECLEDEYTYESYSPRDGESKSKSRSRKAADRSTEYPRSGANSANTSPDDPGNKNKLLKGNM